MLALCFHVHAPACLSVMQRTPASPVPGWPQNCVKPRNHSIDDVQRCRLLALRSRRRIAKIGRNVLRQDRLRLIRPLRRFNAGDPASRVLDEDFSDCDHARDGRANDRNGRAKAHAQDRPLPPAAKLDAATAAATGATAAIRTPPPAATIPAVCSRHPARTDMEPSCTRYFFPVRAGRIITAATAMRMSGR